MLIDVAKPTTDTSYLEIEKSTLNGRPYQTGGGRTLNAHDIDMLLTWIVNRDREPLVGGATRATQLGRNTFPYLAPPNTELQTVAESIVVNASADKVWALIGAVRRDVASADCPDPLDRRRRRATAHGRDHRRQRSSSSAWTRPTTRGASIAIRASPAWERRTTREFWRSRRRAASSSVTWRVQYLSDGQPTIIIRTIVATLQKVGLESLKKRFG